MQSRWGTHGDRPAIVLSAATVPEMYFLTIKAVNLSEKFRLPVILLSDESIGHLRERIEIPGLDEVEIVNRPKPNVSPLEFEPLKAAPDEVPPMAVMGEGYAVKGYCRLVRNFKGDPTSDKQIQEYLMTRLQNKITSNLGEIQIYEEIGMQDADVVIFVHGSMARPAFRAARLAKNIGIKAGVFKATTIYPFPKRRLEEIAKRVNAIIVPELNFGQLVHEVESACRKAVSVIGIQKVNGDLIPAEEILVKIKETVG
jgi:2-oxoglutarate ferredoxin oxidoreductase subunit alpha